MAFNNGQGIFGGLQFINIGNNLATVYNVALGDADADGDLALFAVNYGPVSTVSLRFNNGTGPPLAVRPVGAPLVALTAYPTPAPATAPIQLTGATAHQQLTLLDAVGRAVASLPTDATGAATLPAGTLAPGLYVVRTPDGRAARLVVE